MDESLEIDLDPSEWDFRDIPVEEQKIAVIYEFSREVPEVSKQISDWLDGELMLIYEGYDHSGDKVFESGLSPQGISVRESLASELRGELSVCRDEEWAPPELWSHKIRRIRHTLAEWPKPYVVAMGCDPVKLGIKHTLGELQSKEPKVGLSPLGQLRSSNREACHLPKRFGGLSVSEFDNLQGLPTYGFDIDMTFNRTEIVNAFKGWLEKEHARIGKQRPKDERPGPGRKPGKRVSEASLSALSAFRLTKRGQTGKKRDHEWVGEALSSYVKLTTNPSNPFPSDTLPWLGEKGFREAVGRAEELIEEFQKYRVWDEKLGRTVEKKVGG
jgi:hypothetical protein